METGHWEEFKNTLLATERKGMKEVVAWLENSDFRTAPGSRNDHSNYQGGLLMHSLYTYRLAQKIADDLRQIKTETNIAPDSLAISALLHDVCKIDRYVLGEDGKYTKKENDFPVGHGEKSVFILLRLGLEMTDEEIAAIRYHMGPFNLQLNNTEMKEDYFVASRIYPLVPLIHTADTLTTCIIE